MVKLGSSSLPEPGAYLLGAQNQAQAYEPKPRLVPPLEWSIFHSLGPNGEMI